MNAGQLDPAPPAPYSPEYSTYEPCRHVWRSCSPLRCCRRTCGSPPSSCCSSSNPPSATSSPLPYSPEQWGHQTAGNESGAARSSATSPMAVAPARRWPGAALPSSGEEGPGQDLQASYLSMKIGGMFQEVIAMSVPVLNQSSSAPFQAIIGTTSDILLTAKPGSHFSLSVSCIFGSVTYLDSVVGWRNVWIECLRGHMHVTNSSL
uniref:Uncharacterized protein n=1 Tax=Oryza glumipatula TaxID=40148 RepID=A0A0D9ZXM6_9ORYZ